MTANVIFETSGLPALQNKVYNTPEEAKGCPKGDVRLIQDKKSGIVFNTAFQPEKVVYDENYQNEQGCSTSFSRHLQEVAGIIEKHSHGKTILEIGCGKGSFIELLRARNMNATGLDPAYEGHSPYIIRQFFSSSLGLTGEVIVLRHVLEHIANPFNFLENIAKANGGKGLIYIEVPCFGWITEKRAWYDIYYEHVNYFRLSDFSRIFGTILDSGRLFGGQYIYVVADLASLCMNSSANEEIFSIPSEFFTGIEKSIKIIENTRERHHIIWGAASKGVLFALYLQRRGYAFDFAIDINPAKQNKYLPATGLKVLSPEAAFERLCPGDVIFVMNPNYYDEIRCQGGPDYEYFLS